MAKTCLFRSLSGGSQTNWWLKTKMELETFGDPGRKAKVSSFESACHQWVQPAPSTILCHACPCKGQVGVSGSGDWLPHQDYAL